MPNRDEHVEKTPHPEDCDHKLEAKAGTGHGDSGANARIVWQCMNCGWAKLSRHRETGEIYNGWNPKPEPEPEDEVENRARREKKSLFEAIFG